MVIGVDEYTSVRVPATTSVINRFCARYNRALKQNTPLGIPERGVLLRYVD